MDVPAELIQQEASLCTLPAMLAVAWIFQVNQNWRMVGQSEPGPVARWVANYWRYMPNPAPEASFLFSRADLRLPAVQNIIRRRGPPRAIFRCNAGLALVAF